MMHKINFTDRMIAYMALLSGLSISAVAIYYSVAGLVAIFSAAVVPIIVMGIVLEVGKLVATMWLKQNWDIAPTLIKTYLIVAVAVLMVITSLGIFGFLSKAHSDQSLVSGDVIARIAVYDDQIKTAKDNIDSNRKALRQLDDAVDQVMSRSSDEKGADKAVAIRKSQQRDRARLQAEITVEQRKIGTLSQARAPIAADVRKVEAEVGPIKYIAALIYGDDPDTNTLERAVRWVIIIIVAVFDPLAVIMLLASQYSFTWFRQRREFDAALPIVPVVPAPAAAIPVVATGPGATLPSEPIDSVSNDDIELYSAELARIKQDIVAPTVPPAAVQLLPDQMNVTVLTTQPPDEPDDADWPATPSHAFAPPGTPGEAWDMPADTESEQQSQAELDKIYTASVQEHANQTRGRGWFQPVFPKKS